MLRVCRSWPCAKQLSRGFLPAAANNLHTSTVTSAIQLKMPSLSPTMTEGTIVKWLKKEGENFEAGDVVCEIQTDKAVVSMEVDDEGVMAKILSPADSGSIKVGELIALVAEEGEDWKEVAAGHAPDGKGADDSTQAAAAEPAMTGGGSVAGTAVNMPSLSPTMTEGTIVKWYKSEGEAVGAGDLLCDIQTDKAVVSMEADDDGVLAKILVKDGSGAIQVGVPIAVMVEEGEDWKDVAIPVAGGAKPPPSSSAAPVTSSPPPDISAAAAAPVVSDFVHPVMTGPATALLLSQYGIQPSAITGSGPKGNIVKSDVLEYIQQNNLTAGVQMVAPPATAATSTTVRPPPPASQVGAAASVAATKLGYTDIELSSMRRVIAKRLTDSKQTAPHGYSSAVACIDSVSRLRQDYIRSGYKVSINDFVVKAAATALQYVPELNVHIVDEQPVPVTSIDVSIAVATPAGLITPIVKDASSKPVQSISAEIKELAGRARDNKLKLDEFQGGTFTISNLGMFGIAEFTAIINAPQAAILAVGGGRQVINPDTMKPETVMTSTLSFDRRFIDEALAADFMTVFRTLMERPELLGTGYLPSVRTDRAAAQLQ